ncbi:hypothetical protein E2C01_076824 [Portunus trituberculatus]|uniref:Uncharacterized protein n=1 Tax=Portunus trituberculatus TaxID=210409 RepID=A0A5B7IKN9_PORTR|nr:hypothetical protein [Portunus trituberculatus]
MNHGHLRYPHTCSSLVHTLPPRGLLRKETPQRHRAYKTAAICRLPSAPPLLYSSAPPPNTPPFLFGIFPITLDWPHQSPLPGTPGRSQSFRASLS